MRSYDKHRNTKFIQKSEIENSPHGAVLVTIEEVTEENVAPEYQSPEVKYVLYFEEDYKPWAPCWESLEVIAQVAGVGDVDRWPGTKIVLYVDPSVKFGRKTVGGIRCREPKSHPGQVETKPVEDPDVPNF